MSTDCNSHEFLWKADRAIPMWSGEWTPPEGSSMARGYAHEITNEWRQYWNMESNNGFYNKKSSLVYPRKIYK